MNTLTTTALIGAAFIGGTLFAGNRSQPPKTDTTERLHAEFESVDKMSTFERAIWIVESNGRHGAIFGDGGVSRGPLQCGRLAYADAVQYDPTLRDGSYEDVDRIEYAVRVFRAYTDRYATERRLGRTPTNEDRARIWNGGPRGHLKRAATEPYWQRVKSIMNGGA